MDRMFSCHFRCTTCKNSGGDSIGKCSYVSNGTSKFWLRKTTKKLDSYELFATDMGSIRTEDIKIYKEDRESGMKNKGSINIGIENGTGSPVTGKSRSNLQSPEYVKRTAKMFETVRTVSGETDVETMKNGLEKNGSGEGMMTTNAGDDSTDGEMTKKPSYLGVSCSNSGYRNVINYNSKLREGFHSANSPRESLMVCSSRLRENSPLRRDVEFIYRNGKGAVGSGADSLTVTLEEKEETMKKTTANGVSKFMNISTSTKTISTFRNSKELEKNVSNSEERSKSNGETTNVNLNQILNGKTEGGVHRRGYSNLGFSPKILKSPEKNCNSFLKSISSFENNCRKWETRSRTTSNYTRGEQTTADSTNSIQQRIERLYGPGALAQGFYAQKPKGCDKTEESQSSDRFVDSLSNAQSGRISLSALTKAVTSTTTTTATPMPGTTLTHTTQNGNSLPVETKKMTATRVEEAVESKPTPAQEVATTEKQEDESQAGDSSTTEKNGLYFLKLLKKETDRLERLAEFAEKELENGENLPEEINGKLRAAAGKARLLVCQKLHQFEGLCHKNMNEKPSEPFPTTSEDLAGFWDMVMLQVVQVYGVFDELEQLKKNNWKVPAKTETSTTGAAAATGSPTSNGQTTTTTTTKTTPKKSTPASSGREKPSEKAEAAKKAREETRRKMLEERRKKMKELKENKIIGNNNEDGVEIFAK